MYILYTNENIMANTLENKGFFLWHLGSKGGTGRMWPINLQIVSTIARQPVQQILFCLYPANNILPIQRFRKIK